MEFSSEENIQHCIVQARDQTGQWEKAKCNAESSSKVLVWEWRWLELNQLREKEIKNRRWGIHTVLMVSGADFHRNSHLKALRKEMSRWPDEKMIYLFIYFFAISFHNKSFGLEETVHRGWITSQRHQAPHAFLKLAPWIAFTQYSLLSRKVFFIFC